VKVHAIARLPHVFNLISMSKNNLNYFAIIYPGVAGTFQDVRDTAGIIKFTQ
jgi:hypothetical protein